MIQQQIFDTQIKKYGIISLSYLPTEAEIEMLLTIDPFLNVYSFSQQQAQDFLRKFHNYIKYKKENYINGRQSDRKNTARG